MLELDRALDYARTHPRCVLVTLRSRDADAADSTGKSDEALDMKYQAADWNGWQTAYAFDIALGIKGATHDTSASRAAFLDSAAARQAADGLQARPISTRPRSSSSARRARPYDAFMKLDEQMIALYRTGSAGQGQGRRAVLTTEIENYTKTFEALQSLADDTAGNARDDVAAAARGRARQAQMIAIVLLGIVMVGLIVFAVVTA